MLFGKNGRKDDLRRPGRARARPGRGHRRGARRHGRQRRDRRARRRARRERHRVVDGAGLVLAPAFVDPHVHLRTPGPRGRGDDRLRHRGGRGRRLLRDPRDAEHRARSSTRPPCSASLVEQAQRRGASSRSGSWPRSRRARTGAELTEMGELADAGAAGFTDDGRPVVAPGLMRRALQYQPRSPAGALALHCEEPTLSRGGQMHEGAVSAELGFAGYPSVAESVMVERDLVARRLRGRSRCTCMHLSARESVERAARARRRRASRRPAEVTPHHLCLTDEAVRSLDSNVKMNPPLALGRRPRGARSTACATGRSAASPPTTRRTRGTRRRCRSRRRRSASPGSRPPSPRSTRTSSSRACSRSRRCSSGCRPARRARTGSSRRGSRSARRRTSSCSTPRRPGG